MAEQALRFFTVGHSSHAAEHFLALLRQHAIDVIVDTRSAPYSRYSPQFDRETLKENLLAAGVKYLWMGDVVGGRPRDESCYDSEGRVLYSRVSELPAFAEGIERLERGAANFRVALLCAEENPAYCHRRLLISRVLTERGATITHIRGNGSLNTDADVTAQSGKKLTGMQPALFAEIEEEQWRSTSSLGRPVATNIFD